MAVLRVLLNRLPYLLCGIAVYLLASPATQKLFTNNAAMVGFFTSLNLPAPELTVILIGVIELLAMLAFITGIGGRFMAGILIVEMIVAMATAGRNDNNTVLIVCSIGILIMGTGRESVWQPAENFFRRLTPKFLQTDAPTAAQPAR